MKKKFSEKPSIKHTHLVKKILFISIPSILLAILLLELSARFFLKTSDSPDVYFDQFLGNRYLPNQTGSYIKGKKQEIYAKYTINNDGWNYAADYKNDKDKNIYRIAVVGDSFIEALQVNNDRSYPYILQKLLKSQNQNVQVYSFGHSGANFLHYFYMTDYVQRNYNPDLIIVNLVLNDFDESLYGLNRKDNWSLKPYYQDFVEVIPQKASNLNFKRTIRKSALARFLTLNLDLVNTSPILNKLFYAETKNYKDTTQIREQFSNEQFLQSMINYTIAKYENSFGNSKIIFVIDGNRQTLYKGLDPKLEQNYKINLSIKKASEKFNIKVIDLTDMFKNDWDEKHKMFNWEIDDHWNEYGHQLVAEYVYQQVKDVINLTPNQEIAIDP